MEINANPSLNMFLERELANGDHERTVSELDKHLKMMVLDGAIKIGKARKPLDDLGEYEQIYPRKEAHYEKYYIWEQARLIFSKLGGLKDPEYLTNSQF